MSKSTSVWFDEMMASVTILVNCNQEENLWLGWGCCRVCCYAVVSADRGCPITWAPVESNRNPQGMPGTSPSHSSPSTTDQKPLTHFVYNSCRNYIVWIMSNGIEDM